MNEMFKRYQQTLQRLDCIERRIEQSVADKRSRALMILQETPTHRQSHLRCFVSHFCSTVPDTSTSTSTDCGISTTDRWTLVIEGHLLVGHLDHQSAQRIDVNATANTNTNTSTSTSTNNTNASIPTSTFSSVDASKFISDKEMDEPVIPVRFTDCFDKVSVSFQTFTKLDSTAINTNANTNTNTGSIIKDGITTSSSSKASSKMDDSNYTTDGNLTTYHWTRGNANNADASITGINNIATTTTTNSTNSTHTEHNLNANTSATSASTSDSHAFHIIHETKQNVNINTPESQQHPIVIATIHLYRRGITSSSSSSGITTTPSTTDQQHQQQQVPKYYKPSKQLMSLLFPLYDKIPNSKGKSSNKAKNKPALNIKSTTKNQILSTTSTSTNKNTNQLPSSSSSSSSSSFYTPVKIYRHPPIHCSVKVPPLFTMDEILNAIYTYIKDRNLIQSNDHDSLTSPPSSSSTPLPSDRDDTHGQHHDEEIVFTIQNDVILESLFECKEMKFHSIRDLLLTKELLIPIVHQQPIPSNTTLTTNTFGTTNTNSNTNSSSSDGMDSNDSPIVITYILEKNTASKNKREQLQEDQHDQRQHCEDEQITNTTEFTSTIQRVNDNATSNTFNEEKSDLSLPKKRRLSPQTQSSTTNTTTTTNQSTTNTITANSHTTTDTSDHYPSLLSFDITVYIPRLLHTRTRDILRRIKFREYEYTSCRTKAIRMMQVTKAEEDILKVRLEEIVKNKGLTVKHHLPLLLGLAKAASVGSEARVEAHLDARISFLVERLEYHCEMGRVYRNIVEACGGTNGSGL